ncbi:hypothetical protein FYK55_15120 [Roseiconus nitratireducens]|uniref:Uncharacterized protein n=1 Tax=Roseiconus nitratireducens TaxID=2605748 RepID=A0A5M6D3Q6_9BACT|nr:hypothetical protein [Roseiconus nitratireducens]KAA5542138.1 hypothetical protein FYK55_15120 [Roseiconus nitratireducens]
MMNSTGNWTFRLGTLPGNHRILGIPALCVGWHARASRTDGGRCGIGFTVGASMDEVVRAGQLYWDSSFLQQGA